MVRQGKPAWRGCSEDEHCGGIELRIMSLLRTVCIVIEAQRGQSPVITALSTDKLNKIL